MNTGLKILLDDFGGGRKKQTEESQIFYDLAHVVLTKLNNQSFLKIEEFTEYLKEIAKRNACVNIFGRE